VSKLLLNFIPNQTQAILPIRSSCSVNVDDCVASIIPFLSFSWSGFQSRLLNIFDIENFPLIDTVIYTAIWLLLIQMSSNLGSAEQVASATRSSAQAILMVSGLINSKFILIPWRTWSNSILIVILFISLWLSLSSIIAIPALDEQVTNEILAENDLRQRLTSKVLDKTHFADRFPDRTKSADIVKSIDVALANSSANNIAIVLYKEDINGFKRRIEGAERDLLARKERFFNEQTRNVDFAMDAYVGANRGRRGARQTMQHAFLIELSYSRWWDGNSQIITTCNSDVDGFENTVELNISSMISYASSLPIANKPAQVITNAPTQSASGDSTHLLLDNGVINRFDDLIRNARIAEDTMRDSCRQDSGFFDIPPRSSVGYFGVFGGIANWLLQTEQPALALITGLLGFGLLGAACSTVIRNVPNRAAGDPLVPNLTSVVIRGVSAAILVFLGVFGGLAVFSTGTVNPNPYVVLFTCLAAAVFSDDAWAWGARQFKSKFSDDAHAAAPDEPPQARGVSSGLTKEHDIKAELPNRSLRRSGQ
jgi:hypothetical protein